MASFSTIEWGKEEIYETIREYQRTRFGGWPWPKDEFVHPREKGRFALHADGEEEVKQVFEDTRTMPFEGG